jgi:hypothetical protein
MLNNASMDSKNNLKIAQLYRTINISELVLSARYSELRMSDFDDIQNTSVFAISGSREAEGSPTVEAVTRKRLVETVID